MRLIDTETVIRKLRKANCAECDNYNAIRCRACWVDDVVSLLDDSPKVDAVEVVHGRWAIINEYCCVCSVCHNASIQTYYFCPECGAKMDGGNEDGKD